MAANSASKKGRIRLPSPRGLGPGVYLITAAQNNTRVHPGFWRNLEAYKQARGARLLVVRFTYDKRGHRQKVSAGDSGDDLWWAPEILPYLCDGPGDPQQWRLAPSLMLEAHMDILPTKQHPLSGMQGFGGASSVIFAHATQAMESIPTAWGKPAKFQYTTGACTKRNYIQKTAGQKAEFHHCYGALVVEVDSEGRWKVRQLNATENGNFYDLDKQVKDGRVTSGHRALTLVPGDIHAMLIPPDVLSDLGDLIDFLKPRNIVLHDTFDFGSGEGHHDRDMVNRQRLHGWCVSREIRKTREVVSRLSRSGSKTYVVASNHDQHADRWLSEADPRVMNPSNLEVYCEGQLARARALSVGNDDWRFTPWALGNLPRVKFLKDTDSLLLKGVEHAWHGHRGPNGARGSLASLLKCAPKFTVGHHHAATIRHGGYVVGVCSHGMGYALGPGAWSVSHCVQYDNGKRAMITCPK